MEITSNIGPNIAKIDENFQMLYATILYWECGGNIEELHSRVHAMTDEIINNCLIVKREMDNELSTARRKGAG